MTKKSHNPFAKVLLTAAVLFLLLTTSCERKQLWLPNTHATVDLALYDIDLELYFGFNWKLDWQYDWPEDNPEYGPLGYTAPYGVRATIFTLEGMSGRRTSPYIKNMTTDAPNRVTLNAASWYDMLFYNTGTQSIIFKQDDDQYLYYNSTTRANGMPSYLPTTREGDTTEPEDETTYKNYNQPDELFGVLVKDLYVSEDPDDYELTTDDDGNNIYLYHINATLEPYSFIYLIEPIIINNYMDANDPEKPDSTARIQAVTGLTVTGLAQGVELFSRQDWLNGISISTEDIKKMQTHKKLSIADGRTFDDADICASRILTWGLPGIDPLEARRILDETGVPPTSMYGNKIGLNILFRGGTVKAIQFDITDLMVNHPAGGVIPVVIDASDFSREDVDKNGGSKTGGGFNASVGEWNNEVNSEITI